MWRLVGSKGVGLAGSERLSDPASPPALSDTARLALVPVLQVFAERVRGEAGRLGD